jgi:hypothetical protein
MSLQGDSSAVFVELARLLSRVERGGQQQGTGRVVEAMCLKLIFRLLYGWEGGNLGQKPPRLQNIFDEQE